VATIEEMQRLKLVERAAELEPYVRAKLEAVKAKHPSVGDVRASPLLCSGDRQTARPTALQHHARQGGRQAAGRRPDCRKMMAQGVQFRPG